MKGYKRVHGVAGLEIGRIYVRGKESHNDVWIVVPVSFIKNETNGEIQYVECYELFDTDMQMDDNAANYFNNTNAQWYDVTDNPPEDVPVELLMYSMMLRS